MMEYKQLKRKNVDAWVKNLLRDKGGEEQVELLRKTFECGGAEYVTFIERSIAQADSSPYTNPQDEALSMLDDSGAKMVELTPGHMYSMPPADIMRLYRNWKEIPYATAAMPTFWGATTLQAIQDRIIEPQWLAVGPRDTRESTISKLDKAIRGEGEGKKYRKTRDDLVRRILRWMMGPGHMRGAAELYANCSLAKAWWCGYIADDCSKDDSLDISFAEAVKVFAVIWPEYSTYLAGRLTAAGFPSVYRGLALWTSRWLEVNAASKLTNMRVRTILKRLGEMSSWCMLGLKPPLSIKELTNKIDLDIGEVPASAD